MKSVLSRICTHVIFALFTFATLAGGRMSSAAEPEGDAAKTGMKYTATACLRVARHEPHILPQATQKEEPGEFESFRATQMQLMKSRFVLIAALRDPRAKNRPSIRREDARHKCPCVA